MVEYYRPYLLKVKNGEKLAGSIPIGPRKRLMEYGILRKFGTKFELTELGMKLLQKNSNEPDNEPAHERV